MKKNLLKSSDTSIAYKFLFPALFLILVFKLYPIVYSLFGSLYQNSFLHPGKSVFVGLNNYLDLLKDKNFYNSIWVTIKLNLLINPIQILISLAMALIINTKARLIWLYKAFFYVPLGVSLAVATTYWGIILKPFDGVLNYIFNSIGIARQPFYFSASQAIWVILIIASWKGCSFWMLFLHAGLQDISKSSLEAADIDGAGSIRKFFSIILPQMKRPILFVLVADTSINFMLFIPIFMLTKGGPDNSTNVLLYEAFKSGILQGDMGHALAMSSFLLGLLAMVLILQFVTLKSDDNDDA